jgi:hypothetical protein
MLLVAGIPHALCRCPDGNIKLFCFGSGASDSGCCCEGKHGQAGKSSSPPVESEPSCCCCPHAVKKQTPAGAPREQVQACGCSRFVAQTPVFTSTTDSTVAGKALLSVALPPATFTLPVTPGSSRECWTDHERGPPPDLITLLRRLLI